MSPQDSSGPLGRVGFHNSLSLQGREGLVCATDSSCVGMARKSRESPGADELVGSGGRAEAR